MGEFKRGVSKELINKLKEEPLFKDKLLPNIEKSEVFLAIRDNRIDFYYYKSRLFSYDGKFITDSKYAFVPVKYKKGVVKDNEITSEIADFYSGYENIKERAKLYASIESIGVNDILNKGNILNNNDYIVLDTEIEFVENKETELIPTIDQIEESQIEESENEKSNKINRIDLLLYGIKEQNLVFIEAKHYTNGDIRSKTTPAVVDQVSDYNDVIKNCKNEILSVYTQYVQNLNDIFGTALPTPKTVNAECGLVIFGYDEDQRDNYLKTLRETKLKDIKKLYKIGDAKQIKLKTLYKALNK